MPATAIFTTAQAYIDAVQACNDAVVVAIQTPGADIVNLMTSIRPQVNAIFETRRQKQLSPTVLGETYLVHRFAAKYIKTEREGRSIDEGFRQKIQEMAAKTTPKPAQQSRPPVPTHPAANPTSTMSEDHPPLAQAVPKTVKAAL
ncbi:hypothetical protein CPC08DRAFT_729106 [Agrocybe pediades]|nr:hypothetical protein CPC08DRAFT_729106 [Agrocybe pediades]